MLTDGQRIALLPKVMQKGKEPVTQVWLTQGDALSYSERIESAACADRVARIAELEQRNRDLHEDVKRFRNHALNEKDARMALERELAEARKDAERYRWLAWTSDTQSIFIYEIGTGQIMFGNKANDTIDAAMKGQQ